MHIYFFRISRCISSLKSLIFPNQAGRCRRIVILGSARWKFAAIHKSTNICQKKYNQTYVHTYNRSLISGTSSIFSFLQNLILIFDESKLHTFSLFCPRLLYGVLLTVNVKSFETKNNKSCYFVSVIYEMHFRQLL